MSKRECSNIRRQKVTFPSVTENMNRVTNTTEILMCVSFVSMKTQYQSSFFCLEIKYPLLKLAKIFINKLLSLKAPFCFL